MVFFRKRVNFSANFEFEANGWLKFFLVRKFARKPCNLINVYLRWRKLHSVFFGLFIRKIYIRFFVPYKSWKSYIFTLDMQVLVLHFFAHYCYIFFTYFGRKTVILKYLSWPSSSLSLHLLHFYIKNCVFFSFSLKFVPFPLGNC